jgi:Cys-tRNA(Pro) deacylase
MPEGEGLLQMADYPVTPGVRLLRSRKIPFIGHLYPFEEHGGTHHAAEVLKVSEHEVVKTLVMETESKKPILVLMHGDCEVSTRQLARLMGVKHITPCEVEVAQKHTGYQVGGISPFGTRRQMPVYAESSLFQLSRIYINGGKRGFLVEIDPNNLREVLNVTEVEVALQASP